MRTRRDESGGRLWIGRLCLSFQRIRSDGSGPALGPIPLLRVAEFPRARALGWPATAALVHIPEGESLWIGLAASTAGATAIRVRFDDLDAIAGGPWARRPSTAPQNYVVWPGQRAIEGIYRSGRLASRFSLGADPWRALELGVLAPRARARRLEHRARRGARLVPPVMHGAVEAGSGAQGDDGGGTAPATSGVVVPDRTGIRWKIAPEATVRVYTASPATYRDVSGREPLPPVRAEDAYRGVRLP